MGRRKTKTLKRPITDKLYGSNLIGKLINRVMQDGKKSVAEREVYRAFDIVKSKIQDHEPLDVFQEAIKNVTPQMEVRSRRIGGAAYQVPTTVRGNRRLSLGLRWIIFEARSRPNSEFKTFADKLAAEIVDAYKNEGGAVKRKDTVHKMAEANRAFSHFRW